MGFWIHLGPLSKVADPDRVGELRQLLGADPTKGEGRDGATRWQSNAYPKSALESLADRSADGQAILRGLEPETIIAGGERPAVEWQGSDNIPIVSARLLLQELEACARAHGWDISKPVAHEEPSEFYYSPGVAQYLARDLALAASRVVEEGTVALVG